MARRMCVPSSRIGSSVSGVPRMARSGGGNCTRSPGSAMICPQCGYDIVTEARPEMGREGAALRDLVANWHSLTFSVRAMIVDLLLSG